MNETMNHFSNGLALTMAATAYLVNVLSMLIHELGHGIGAITFGGNFVRLFVAPTVVGYVYWSGVTQNDLNWVTGAGPITGVLIGLIILLATCLLAKRNKPSWLVVFLAFLALDLIVMDSVYILFSIANGWGDGHDLVQRGVSTTWLVISGLVVIFGPGISAAVMVIRSLSRYIYLNDFKNIWSTLIAFSVPVHFYAMLKSYLFMPAHFTRKRTQAIAFLALSLPIAALITLLMQKIGFPNEIPKARLSNWTTSILVLVGLAVEILFSWHFGFAN